jgi:hypothetical protein
MICSCCSVASSSRSQRTLSQVGNVGVCSGARAEVCFSRYRTYGHICPPKPHAVTRYGSAAHASSQGISSEASPVLDFRFKAPDAKAAGNLRQLCALYGGVCARARAMAALRSAAPLVYTISPFTIHQHRFAHFATIVTIAYG